MLEEIYYVRQLCKKKDAEQFDDLTMLCIEYKGTE